MYVLSISAFMLQWAELSGCYRGHVAHKGVRCGLTTCSHMLVYSYLLFSERVCQPLNMAEITPSLGDQRRLEERADIWSEL